MSELLEAVDVMLSPQPRPLGCTIVTLHTPCLHICVSWACSCEHCSGLSADEKPFPQLKVEKNSGEWHWLHIQKTSPSASLQYSIVLGSCEEVSCLAGQQLCPRKWLCAVLCHISVPEKLLKHKLVATCCHTHCALAHVPE